MWTLLCFLCVVGAQCSAPVRLPLWTFGRGGEGCAHSVDALGCTLVDGECRGRRMYRMSHFFAFRNNIVGVVVTGGSKCVAHIGESCGQGAVCAVGLLCVASGKNGTNHCVNSAAGLGCKLDSDCNKLLLSSGEVYACEDGSCVAVGYAGDACGANKPPCIGNSTCNTQQCIPRQVDERCVYSEDCGIGGYCDTNHRCKATAFAGENCGGNTGAVCQQGTFCSNGECQLLFTQGVGQNCSDSVECNVNSLCVGGVCTAIPPEYGAPCTVTCPGALQCMCNKCTFANILGDEMQPFVGCRQLLANAYTCAALIGCDPKALSCNQRNGCWYDYTRLRNCFFCNASASADVRASNSCLLSDCGDPGLARLTLVIICTAAVCAALLLFSMGICFFERRKNRARQYVEVH